MSITNEMVLVRRVSKRTEQLEGLTYVLDRSISGSRGNGWDYIISKKPIQPSEVDGHYVFRATVRFTKQNAKGDAYKKQWKEIVMMAAEVGRSTKYNKFPWKVEKPVLEEDEAGNVVEDQGVQSTRVPISQILEEKATLGYSEVTMDEKDYFSHIYERDAQIRLIKSAIETARMTNYSKRNHCLLYGPPACGKTQILIAVSNMLGKEGEQWMKFDSTSASKAGIEAIFLDMKRPIPPVLLVEELEKVSDEANLRYMLGLMDQRAELRKINYRVNKTRSVPVLVLATVNNMDLLEKMMSGALLSRFSHHLYCPKPSRGVLKKILWDEMQIFENRNPKWIDSALDFVERFGVTDPRKIIPIVQCGRDGLLDGSYQRDLLESMDPSKQGVKEAIKYYETYRGETVTAEISA